jgi:hypothetical protein
MDWRRYGELGMKSKIRYGVIFRLESWWIGVHWSPKNRRLCINLIPMLTFWISLRDGITPDQGHDIWRSDAQ